MAELSIPYVQRKLQRGSTGGGGGARIGAIPQPQVPDVSRALGPLQTMGDELDDAAAMVGRVQAQRQKAKDTVALVQMEATIDEAVGERQREIMRDQSIDPFDYGDLLKSFRDDYIKNLQVPGRLKEQAAARMLSTTTAGIVRFGAEGDKLGVKRAKDALALRTDQLLRAQLAEPDQAQRDMLGGQITELYRGYVESGILSATEASTELQGIRDKAGKIAWENLIRTDPDQAVSKLEGGYSASLGLAPGDYAELTDTARRVQRERFSFLEAKEAAVERDTKKQQDAEEAVAMGQLQARKLNKAGLDSLRDSRRISADGYQTLVRYLDARAREDRAEARANESLNMQRQEKRNRETDAQLSILATTGQLDTAGVIAYAQQKKLPASAIDGAVMKAKAYQQSQSSEHRVRHNQAEQMAMKAFTKGPFEILEPVTAQAVSALMDDLTNGSAAFGGDKDPITLVQELIPKYQAVLSGEMDKQLQGIAELLRYPDPKMLEADKPNIPRTVYEQQQKLFKQQEQLTKQQQTLIPPGGKKPSGPTWWERIAPEMLGGKPSKPTDEMGR